MKKQIVIGCIVLLAFSGIVIALNPIRNRVTRLNEAKQSRIDLISLPPSERNAAIRKLDPEKRYAVWMDKFNNISQKKWTESQKNLFAKIVNELSPEVYAKPEARLKFQNFYTSWEDEALKVFTAGEIRSNFYLLYNPGEEIYLPVNISKVSSNQLGDCNCSSGNCGSHCNGHVICRESVDGCGAAGTYPCDGVGGDCL